MGGVSLQESSDSTTRERAGRTNFTSGAQSVASRHGMKYNGSGGHTRRCQILPLINNNIFFDGRAVQCST